MTGKVIEDVAANLAVYITDRQSGWGHDVVTGQEAFTAEDWGIRNKWLWTPTASTRILLHAQRDLDLQCIRIGPDPRPHYVADFAADSVIPGSVGDFDLNANVSYADSFYWFPDESMRQPVVNLLNASVKWTHPSRRYDLRLSGANLTGAEYYSFGSESIAMASSSRPNLRARLESRRACTSRIQE